MTINKMNRSGDPTIDRSDNYYQKTWDETIEKSFSQTVFIPYPALLCKELVNGHHSWKPYDGGEYNKDKYELIDNMWDHEHCSICNFKIIEGNSYWFNKNRVRLLCDECYEYYKNKK